MAEQSAGLIVYRRQNNRWEVFLVHPGGPYWKNKDEGVWSIPKGEFTAIEDPLEAACREFYEETGFAISGTFEPLRVIKQRRGKVVYAWLVAGNFDASRLASNLFSIEWPPRSGILQESPEIDRGEWLSLEDAKRKILGAQRPLIEEAEMLLHNRKG